jgi:hypothetical protein
MKSALLDTDQIDIHRTIGTCERSATERLAIMIEVEAIYRGQYLLR